MREDSQSIDEAAADWASRVEGAHLTPDEQAQLEAWLAGDSRRFGAYARARAVIEQLKSAKALGGDLAHGPVLGRMPKKADPALARRRFLQWGAGGLAAAVGAGLLTRQLLADPGKPYATRRGEIRLVPLSDGSSVTLNTASRITVSLNEARPVIHLLEGEALFNVVGDPGGALLVRIGDTLVRSASGQFCVNRVAADALSVLVQAGLIDIRDRNGAMQPLKLGGNNRVDITADRVNVQALSPAEVTRALVWRDGMLSFDDTPLDQAAAQFARYSDLPIVLDDDALRRETVTGVFSATDPQGFARAVARSLGLHSRKAADGRLHLSRS